MTRRAAEQDAKGALATTRVQSAAALATIRVHHVFAGSVTGRDHRRAYRDGQDGFALVARADVNAAVVTDGCSSGAMSEVGARLGAVWIAELIADTFSSVSPLAADPTCAAHIVTAKLIERLRCTAHARRCTNCPGDDARDERDDRDDGDMRDAAEKAETGAAPSINRTIVADMLLFSFLAAVVTRDHAIIFGVGDGMAWVDGRSIVIDPGPENAPTYAAYALLGTKIEPRILHLSAAEAVDTLAVATDGAEELLPRTTTTTTATTATATATAARGSATAKSSDTSFDALIRDERLLTNPSLLRKRLVVLSDRGMFWDDTTIGVIRRSRPTTTTDATDTTDTTDTDAAQREEAS